MNGFSSLTLLTVLTLVCLNANYLFYPKSTIFGCVLISCRNKARIKLELVGSGITELTSKSFAPVQIWIQYWANPVLVISLFSLFIIPKL